MQGKSSDRQDLFSDEAICGCTGKKWEEWCAILDAWRGNKNSFAAIAQYLTDQYYVRRLWAQAIAFYYRRKQISVS
jgi:hypothetical protein